MKKLLSICLAALLLLSLAACGKTDTDTITDSKADKPAAETAGVGTHHAEIDIQDYGTVTIFSVPTVSTATMCYHLPTSA